MKSLYARAISVVLICACGAATKDQEPQAAVTPSSASRPKPLYALTYVAGPSWKKGKGPGEQDLGAHFAYVDGLFEKGFLVTNGIYGDEVRGMYVFAVASEADVKRIVADDPAVKNGVLASDTITPWLVMWDGLGANLRETDGTYVIEYGPGKSWIAGKPATEQRLDEHFGYVTSKKNEGRLLAAGPLPGTDHGRYIVVASSKSEADGFVAADPGVRSGVLAPISMRPWSPVHRQTQEAAVARRGGK
jgi:uncharacterized protein YciI